MNMIFACKNKHRWRVRISTIKLGTVPKCPECGEASTIGIAGQGPLYRASLEELKKVTRPAKKAKK